MRKSHVECHAKKEKAQQQRISLHFLALKLLSADAKRGAALNNSTSSFLHFGEGRRVGKLSGVLSSLLTKILRWTCFRVFHVSNVLLTEL